MPESGTSGSAGGRKGQPLRSTRLQMRPLVLDRLLGLTDDRPKVLALGVSHDEDSAQNLVINNVKTLESYHVIADFIELPYWYNSIFTGYKKGIITDEELQEHFESLIQEYPETEPQLRAELRKIQTLKPTDIASVAIDVRLQKLHFIPEGLRNSFHRAKELAEQNPDAADSVKYSEYIKEVLVGGVPADTISASLISMQLVGRGNGIVTYGDNHFMGPCLPPEAENSHAILDEALEKQGLKVTHITIAKNGYEFRRMENSIKSLIEKRKKQYRRQTKAGQHVKIQQTKWIFCIWKRRTNCLQRKTSLVK